YIEGLENELIISQKVQSSWYDNAPI
ncbi:uncharacterized protein METZ01_LOCUS177135, partial [marine metagenome]